MFDRRIIANFDWILLILTLLIAGVGLTAVYSATFTPEKGASSLFLKQAQWIAAGFVVMLVVMSVNYYNWCRYAYPFYGLTLVFLLLVMLIGRSALGAARWLSFGPVSFQPSELAKLALIAIVAKYLADHPRAGGYTLKDLARPALMLAAPLILVVKQPDLGTALLFLFVTVTLLFIAGINRKTLIGVLASVAALGPPLLWFAWGHLKAYQKSRIMVFLDPDADPLGIGYHVTQSKIAIGSGMLTGKGFLSGTQSQLKFLPERHTDFIFSVFSEEWGFIGSMTVLILYFLLIMRGLEIANRAKDRLGKLLATGAVTMLFFYVFINIGMTLGIMPVVGVPLPLFSYGGTAMLTTFAAIGILLNVSMRRLVMTGG